MIQEKTLPAAPMQPFVPLPYYQQDGIVIYHGDAELILPALGTFDLLLTDPPYGMNLDTDNSRFSGGTKGNMAKCGNGVGTGKGKRILNDDKPFDPRFMLQAAKEKVVWGWNHFADKLPPGACLVWIKRNEEAYGSFLSDAEVAWKSKGVGVFCRKSWEKGCASLSHLVRNAQSMSQRQL